MSTLNVFVLGLDDANFETMASLPHLSEYRFHRLLSFEELEVGEVVIADLLQKAQQQLDAFDGSIDAVVGYWDFPVSSMVPILCARYGLRAPSLDSVVRCEHKYWSRLEQQKVTDAIPAFGLVDLEADDPRPPDGVSYPFWMKPVKSYSSKLAFKVSDDAEFSKAVAETRDGIGRLGEPFEYVMEQVDLPPEVAAVGGEACLAEEALTGERGATEGYVFEGQPHVYGVLDSVNYPGQPNFLRHQYPSQLPQQVQQRMVEVSEQVIKQVGLESATFSVEFFCRPETGEVSILEINPRHSQAHAALFEQVDGVTNHHCMLSLALGRDPQLPHRQGDYDIAAIYYHRHFGKQGVVRRAPSADDVERVQREIPGVAVHPLVEQGARLADQFSQDEYSVELAELIVAGRDVADMEDKYQRAVDALGFEIEEVHPD